MKNFLAIDQGTTSSRAIVFNSNLQPISESQKEYDSYVSLYNKHTELTVQRKLCVL